MNPVLDTQALEDAMQPRKAEPVASEAAPEAAFGFDMDFAAQSASPGNEARNGGDGVPPPPAGFGFEMFEPATNGAGVASDSDSFALVDHTFSDNGNASQSEDGGSFRYFDTLVDESGEVVKEQPEASGAVFGATGDLPTDTMPRALRDELEGIEFYIAQGYVEIARDTLDRLRGEHGEYPEITALYKRLGLTTSALNEMKLKGAGGGAGVENTARTNGHKEGHKAGGQEVNLSLDEAFGFEVESNDGGFHIDLERTPKGGERQNVTPFMVEKESGLLDQDLLVRFNTSDLTNHADFDSGFPLSGALTPPGRRDKCGKPIRRHRLRA
jgi:hypothetical protein